MDTVTVADRMRVMTLSSTPVTVTVCGVE